MKPPPFVYHAPETLEHALALLAEFGDEAKLLAGGQSLMPMLNFRLLEPTVVVDLNRIASLRGVSESSGDLRVGALTRHREVIESRVVAGGFPIVPEGVSHVAHLSIRNRGTFGGSLVHADPAAELPVLATALDAQVITEKSDGTRRRIPAGEFFLAPLTTDLEADEIVTEVILPAAARHGSLSSSDAHAGRPGEAPEPTSSGADVYRHGWGFVEQARRGGDYAMAAAAAVVEVQRRAGEVFCRSARIALGGVGDVPLRASLVEQHLEGALLTEETIRAASILASETCDPDGDLMASAEYRRHLAAVVVRRALGKALERATGLEMAR